MASYRLSRQAEEDLLSIWRYIAESSPVSATKLVHAIHEQCALLADHPKIGKGRQDIQPGWRSFPIKKYLILYRELPEGIEVVRVVHGSRNLRALFDLDDEK